MLSPQTSRCLPGPRHRRARWSAARHLRDLVRVGQAGICRASERRDLELVEAGQRQVEAKLAKVAELEPEQLAVPAGVQRQLVVGDDLGSLLRFAQAGKLDHRHLAHPELAGRQHPAVAGDDAVLAIDQDRVGPAELADGGRDLRHLRVGMRSRLQ